MKHEPQRRQASSFACNASFPKPNRRFRPRPMTFLEEESAASLGKTLRRLRRMRHAREPKISQRVLAEVAGLSESGVGRIERGEGRTRASSLKRISRALSELRPRLGIAPMIMIKLLDAGPHAIAPEKSHEGSAR